MAKRILVIDDDIVNLRMAEYVLGNTYQVRCVKSGSEGLQLLKSETYDLVLLDLAMPEMNGMEVLQKIRQDAGLQNVKVVMLTASGLKEDVIDAIHLGALDFIRKPFVPAELLERIKKILWAE